MWIDADLFKQMNTIILLEIVSLQLNSWVQIYLNDSIIYLNVHLNIQSYLIWISQYSIIYLKHLSQRYNYFSL